MSALAIDGGKPVRSEMLVFGAPCLGEEEIAEVVDVLRCGWIGTGPRSIRFEEDFSTYVSAPTSLAVSSCTAALHLALLALGVGPGDEVITTSLTFAATANVIVHCGARPVFVDVDPQTLNMVPELASKARSSKTKAAIAVHYAGLPVDMDALALALDGLPLIEDAAHALGARLRGRRVGGLGNMTCFSFYANKNITTAEGGMLTLPQAGTAMEVRLKALRLHGMAHDAWKRYKTDKLMHCEVVEAGYKYNMTDLQAALGVHQLTRVEGFLSRREEIAATYDAAFEGMPGVRRQYRPRDIEQDRHGLHLYVLVLDPSGFTAPRDRIVQAIKAENIGASVHYTPLHQEPFYRRLLGDQDGAFPVAEAVGTSILTLPLTPLMSEQDVDDVVTATRKVLEAYAR